MGRRLLVNRHLVEGRSSAASTRHAGPITGSDAAQQDLQGTTQQSELLLHQLRLLQPWQLPTHHHHHRHQLLQLVRARPLRTCR
jgi:hypothetical protein